MSDKDYLDAQRKALKESVKFFAPENKGQRELWAANTFLDALNIQYSTSEVILVDDPPDVCFHDARFEIKEIMDLGRRRHDEYRQALTMASAVGRTATVTTQFTPRGITLQQVYERVVVGSVKYKQKYPDRFCRTLDVLFYVNFKDIMWLVETPFPDTTALQSHPWRSVSFVTGYTACVFAASDAAPGFIQDVLGKVVHRMNSST